METILPSRQSVADTEDAVIAIEKTQPVSLTQAIRRPILYETFALAMLCLLDMAYTVAVVRTGLATESNPLMAPLIAHSNWAFVLVKSLTFVVPLLIIEIIRPLSPKFIRRALHLGAVAYVLTYLIGRLHIPDLLRFP